MKSAKFDQGTFTVPARTTAVFVVKAEDMPQSVPTAAAPVATTAPTAQPTSVSPTAVPTPAPTVQPTALETASSPILPIVVGGAIAFTTVVAGMFFYRRRVR